MRAETKALYPINWPEISRWTIKARGSKCEECGVGQGERGKILTVHHRDYDPSNCALDNLEVLCQGCHLRKQARELADATKHHKIDKLMRMGQLCFAGMEPTYSIVRRRIAEGP